ncbi:MAG: FAD-dependent oxidoreductase [Thermoleophilia bacterium]|nr:FAD-dependent oxidoreductase [Thermoleophilia bacterium]
MAVTRADVVVVGAGLFGTSVAFQLARREAGAIVSSSATAQGWGTRAFRSRWCAATTRTR